MNLTPRLLSTLLLLMITASCGKKADLEDKGAQDKNIDPSSAEIYFNALQEIKRSINNNNLESLKKTISLNPGIDLNQILDDGDTFLIISIKNDYREIRNYLISQEVQLGKTNVNNETPLMVAVARDKINSVKILLDYKVDIEKKDSLGDTPLQRALKSDNDEVALILLKHGAKVHTTDARGKNALKIAEEHNVPESLDMIKSIMDVELGAPDIASYRTILTQADHSQLTKVLSRYPQIAVDHAYEAINPLAILVGAKDENSAIRSAEILINYKANVNGPFDAEKTPLIQATLTQKKGFAHLYLTAKANPQLLDFDGKSALIHAVELNNPDMVELLLAFSAVEKYTFRKDGKKITYNACTVARATGDKLTDQNDKNDNEKIKDALDCGIFRWLF